MEASRKTFQEKEKEPAARDRATFVCSRDTLDGVYPPLLLAINARRLGMDAAIFFTFSGLNAIRKGRAKKIKYRMPGLMGVIPGMGTVATRLMKRKLEKAGLPDIEDMMDMAVAEGVKFVACRMTVDMMEWSQDEFIEGVEIWTAEDFMKVAKEAKVNLFI